ncbi:MAG: hypothetical protein NTW28_09920 [Candidatus Solibacter sp.]|nr:hypothetical protein [Candidatus Solibacter sp.]
MNYDAMRTRYRPERIACMISVTETPCQEVEMTSQELLSFLNGLGTDLDQLNASQKRLHESAQRLMRMLQDQAQVLASTKQMQETQMSFNLQYLQLQNSMQNENRQFTMISNTMKTKHETAKNSISNVR